MTEPWADRSFLRGTQYKTDANLAARQSIYAYQHLRIDLAARVLDLAELRVPGPDPIVGYVRSMSGTSHDADPERIAEAAAATFPKTSDGHYVITSHSGCLICEVG